jgi:hypothetical protein
MKNHRKSGFANHGSGGHDPYTPSSKVESWLEKTKGKAVV